MNLLDLVEVYGITIDLYEPFVKQLGSNDFNKNGHNQKGSIDGCSNSRCIHEMKSVQEV